MKIHTLYLLCLLLVASLVSVTPLAAQEATCDEGFRLFDHELLATDPVCVPENPERIAMMETVGIELLFVLDIQPVIQNGPYTAQLLNNFPVLEPQLMAYFEGIPDGGYFEVNLEVLLASEPDVIILYDLVATDTELFEAIAPTVVVRLIPDVALDQMLGFHADLLGLEDEVETILDEYSTRAELLGTTIGDEIEEQSVVIGRVDPQLQFFALSPAYTVLRDAGWQPSTDFAEELNTITEEFAWGMRPVSMEELNVLDGDYLFVYDLSAAFDEDAVGVLDEITEQPLWQTLSVVEAGQFYEVPTYWNFTGIISSHFIIDDFWRIFGESESMTPNPFVGENVELEATEETSN